jgi:hypothetical protein
MEFNKGLLDTVVKAACIVELQKERDLEAQKADMFLKAVANVKHAAVSDLVDARTSVMLVSQIALEVCHDAWRGSAFCWGNYRRERVLITLGCVPGIS